MFDHLQADDTALDKSATAEEAIRAARLDWQVKKLPLYASDGSKSLLRRCHPAGESLRAIKKATGLTRATVHRFVRAKSFPERAVCAPGPGRLDPFVPTSPQACSRTSPPSKPRRRPGWSNGQTEGHVNKLKALKPTILL